MENNHAFVNPSGISIENPSHTNVFHYADTKLIENHFLNPLI